MYALPRSIHFRCTELETRFALIYSRQSLKASKVLRLVQAAMWASAWRQYGDLSPRLTIAVLFVMMSLELGTHAALSLSKHWHDKIKSYRFMLATVGSLLLVISTNKPPSKFSMVVPALSHSLFVVADQMRLQSAVNVYAVNSIFFVLLQANGMLGSQLHTVHFIVLNSIIFALGGFLLPCWILFLNEAQASFLALFDDLQPEDLGDYWANDLSREACRDC